VQGGRSSGILKGLRSDTDFAYELPMALMNRHLSGVETVFLPGDPRFGLVSSSLIKEVAAFGGDITGLVPEEVREALLARLQNPEGT
jgi:pantetheine-phosphate adenylyltransferase